MYGTPLEDGQPVAVLRAPDLGQPSPDPSAELSGPVQGCRRPAEPDEAVVVGVAQLEVGVRVAGLVGPLVVFRVRAYQVLAYLARVGVEVAEPAYDGGGDFLLR